MLCPSVPPPPGICPVPSLCRDLGRVAELDLGRRGPPVLLPDRLGAAPHDHSDNARLQMCPSAVRCHTAKPNRDDPEKWKG